jgi:hypothetical protein
MIKSLKYLSFLLILLVIGCDSPEEIESKEILVEEKQPYILLISKDDRNEHIRTWIRSLDAEIIIKQCYGMPKDSLDYYLNIADAIIIGGAVHQHFLELFSRRFEKIKCFKSKFIKQT